MAWRVYSRSMLKKVLVFAGSIIASLAAGGIGSLATVPNIPTWYEHLDKPALIPPNGVFGPTWSVLYVVMGITLALVILQETNASKKPAYTWYAVQLVLNTLWSVVFFGLHQPWLAFGIIIALIASIIMTMREFHKLRPLAMWLLVPYLAWVAFASYLNIGVAILN